ncbi:hypothetical protein D9757_006076 [Collybiopsis confluens]|uniref:Uncharacterized protein n=1 Tax=Collybiopsis confluens TaxID=2823264 RepID=A0A8H5M7D7_9AGAR|nr:hypothetical protein D9757_006076 [Collybiopsis confluens]
MNDEQVHLHTFHNTNNTPFPGHIQPSVLVAVATLVLAGSAVFWRSNLRLGNLRLFPKGLGTEEELGTQLARLVAVPALILTPELSEALDAHGDTDEGGNAHNDNSKSLRSKERRRRRKDPLKDLMKGGKRAKDLAKLLEHVELPGPNDPSSSSSPNLAPGAAHLPSRAQQELPSDDAQPTNHGHNSRSPSRPRDSSSSRSASIFSAKDDDEDREENRSSTAIPPSPVIPSRSIPGHSPSTSYDSTPSIAVSSFSFDSVDTADTSVQSARYHDSDPVLDNDQTGSLASASTPSSKSAKVVRRHKNSNTKNSTPDNISSNHRPTDVSPSQSTLAFLQSESAIPYTQLKDGASSSSTLHPIASSSSSPSPSRAGKPPRFRSQTRPEETASGLGYSTSMPIYSTLHASSTKVETELPEEERVETGERTWFNFPSLNNGSGSGSANDSVPGSSKGGSAGPASTSSTSLSTHTQIASLKGALEASRKREEEAKGREESIKGELERVGNEVKMLRWEGSLWRRREGELQAQVHHLVHHIQSYPAYFPQTSQFAQQQLPPPLQNLAIPQSQPSLAKQSHLNGKRPHTSQNSPASSRSTSKSSRLPRSSQTSPNPVLAQLPESSATQSSSPSMGSPVISPNRMFSPTATFSPGFSSTPFLPNPQSVNPFSPTTSFGMFSPLSPPPSAGLPFASPPLGSAGMMSPLSPHSPYLPYYPSYGVPGQANGSGNSSGVKMHPLQFVNVLFGQTGSGADTENGGDSASSTMSSLASGTESTGSVSPESAASPSPAPGSLREQRGRKRGRGGIAGSGDRMSNGYGPDNTQYGYTYGYPYPYPTPNPYQEHPRVTQPQEDNGTAEQESSDGIRNDAGPDQNGSYNSDSDYDEEGGPLNELLADAILKRPESIVGLRRSGSGSARSSKSSMKSKDKFQISPTQDVFKESVDETMGLTSPSSDSGLGLGLGLDWVKDPALFREKITATTNDTNVSESTSTEADFDARISSSSSSSSTNSTTTSTASEPSEVAPVEFTFPSIATWGYSYQTHSAYDSEDHVKAKEPHDWVNTEMNPEEEQEEQESTPPADNAPILSTPIVNRALSSDASDAVVLSKGPASNA